MTKKLDDRLLMALRGCALELPDDIDQLTGYVRLIHELLGEKAAEREPSWALACASAAEIETLQDLETTVVVRAIGLRVETVEAVLTKLEIWRELSDSGEGGLRDRLVLSIESDLLRLARKGSL